MTTRSAGDGLRGRRVLIVEDEYLIAADLAEMLAELGVSVVGPVGSVKNALQRIDASDGLDAAVLDINLGHEKAFPIADVLIRRGVPFVFTTGYSGNVVPEPYAHIPRCEKPVQIRALANLLKERLVTESGS